jgi:gluconolactonase
MPDCSWALVEMRPDRGCVTHINADGNVRRRVVRTGRPNGLALDRGGTIWVAESLKRSLFCVTMDGKAEELLTHCGREPFLFPNDLAFGPDGALYMTDSGIPWLEWNQRRAEYKSLQLDGRVYRIDTETMQVAKLDSGLPFANGIAFGPDGYLYVSATVSGKLYRYPWKDGTLGTREEFADVVDHDLPEGFRGPDGMKFGADGRLYVAVLGQQEVRVVSPEGTTTRRIKLEGSRPTNVAFGANGSHKIYVTEQGIGQFEVHEVETDGLPLYK